MNEVQRAVHGFCRGLPDSCRSLPDVPSSGEMGLGPRRRLNIFE